MGVKKNKKNVDRTHSLLNFGGRSAGVQNPGLFKTAHTRTHFYTDQ